MKTIKRNADRRRRGFSLAEMLVTVTIIAVLAGIATVTGSRMIRSARQNSYDREAEAMYVAVQRRLTSLSVTGLESQFRFPAGDKHTKTRERDTAFQISLPYGDDQITNGEEFAVYTITYRDLGDGLSQADAVLADGVVSDELRGGCWYLEYSDNGHLIGVFYSPSSESAYFDGNILDTDVIDNTASRESLKLKTTRVRSGARVGYYGGGMGSVPAMPDLSALDVDEFTVWLTVENNEELSATLYCQLPYTAEFFSDIGKDTEAPRPVTFTLSAVGAVTGNDDAPAQRTYYVAADSQYSYAGAETDAYASTDEGGKTHHLYAWRVTLDSLTQHFDAVLPGLTPGENVTLTADADCGGVAAAREISSPRFATQTTNSLFAYNASGDDGTAYIAYGRHLQNLDTAISGVDASIKKAEQLQNIDFAKERGEGENYYDFWTDVYGSTHFAPVMNTALASYDGGAYSIQNLTVDYATGADIENATRRANAGLFGTFTGTLTGVTLIDPVINGVSDTANVGGLVGLAGAVTVSDCALYMDELVKSDTLASAVDWLTGGTYAGGLIGRASGAAAIEDSYAATVVKGTTSGGLIGAADSSLAVTGSYADCYISGTTIGGLAGGAGSGTSFSNSYSAGFVLGNATTAAGFVPAAVQRIDNSYSVFNFDDLTALDHTDDYPTDGVTNDVTTKYGLCSSLASGTAYYAYGGDVTETANTEYKALADMSLTGFTESHDGRYDIAKWLKGAGELTLLSNGLDRHGDWVEKPEEDARLYARLYAEIPSDSPYHDSHVSSECFLVFEYGAANKDPNLGKAQTGYEWKADEFMNGSAPWSSEMATYDSSFYYYNGDHDGEECVTFNKVIFNISDSEEKIAPTSTKDWFSGFGYLTSIVGIERLDTSNVTDMSGMFSDCWSLTSLNVSGFSTAKVTDMSGMFSGCEALASLNVSGFNTAKVTDMSEMFSGCSGLTSLDVSALDTEKVTDMSGMFGGCSGLTSLDVSALDTTNVTSMSGMFSACSGLTEIDVSTFDTKKVTDMGHMFEGCTGLTSLDVSMLDTANVLNMSTMFSDCSGLTTLDVSMLDTANVTDMSTMFAGCTSLTELDLIEFDTANVTDMSRMFSGCSALTTIYASDAFVTTNLTEDWQSTEMFDGCGVLKGGSGTTYDAGHIDKTYARIDGGPTSETPGYFTERVLYAVRYGTGTNGKTLVFQYGSDAIQEYVDAYGAKGDAYKVEESYSSAPDWTGGTKITTVIFDAVIAPTSTAYWFYRCDSLTGIENIERLNTSRVTSMAYMFYGCYNANFKSLDLSGFDTSQVEDMSYMFFQCTKLETIYATDQFVVTQVTDDTQMFYQCNALVGGNGTSYRSSPITDKTRACIDKDGQAGYFTDTPMKFFAVLKGGTLTFLASVKVPVGLHWTDLENTDFGTDNRPGWYSYDDEITRVVFDQSLKDEGFSPISLRYWLFGLTGLTGGDSIDLTGLDLSNTTDMSRMFYHCENITSLDMSGLDTSHVENMEHTFASCKALVTLDLSGSFSTASVMDMRSMFKKDAVLETIYVSSGGFTTSSLLTGGDTDMFSGCTSLEGGAGTQYNASYVNKTYARIDRSWQKGYFTEKAANSVQARGSRASMIAELTNGPVEAVPDYAKLTELEIRYADEDRSPKVFEEDELPDVWFDGEMFFTDPDGPEDSVIERLSKLTDRRLPDDECRLVLTVGDETLWLYEQDDEVEHTDGDGKPYTELEFRRYVLTRTDGTLILTADENGKIAYNEKKDVYYDAETLRFYSDADHTILLTNLTALVGPAKDEDGKSLWCEPDDDPMTFKVRAEDMTAYEDEDGYVTFSIEAVADEWDELDYYTCSVGEDEIFRSHADDDGELTYLYELPEASGQLAVTDAAEPDEKTPESASDEPAQTAVPEEDDALPTEEDTETVEDSDEDDAYASPTEDGGEDHAADLPDAPVTDSDEEGYTDGDGN